MNATRTCLSMFSTAFSPVPSVLTAALLVLSSATSFAQTAVITPAPATALELTYNVGVVSDYRYRGISQTRLKPAVQGGADLSYGAWYAGAWGSNIQWIKDAGYKGGLEIDLYGGYKYEVAKDITLDLGVLAYVYPSNTVSPNANTTELYIGAATGAFSAKYSRSMTNLFGFASSQASSYVEANVDYELVKGMNIVAHIGHQTVKNASLASYTDFKLGASYEALGGKFAASVIGTDNKFYTSPTGKNLAKAGLVLGYTQPF